MGLKDTIFNICSPVMAMDGRIGIKNGQIEIIQSRGRRVLLPLHDVTVSRPWWNGRKLVIRHKDGKTYELHFWNNDDAMRAETNINAWGRWFY